MPAALSLTCEMKGPLGFADFDKRVLKKELRACARPLVKAAKARVGKRGKSAPGQPPAKISGGLQKSITSRVSKSGFSFAVNSFKWKGGTFYPAFVFYGHRAPHSETEKERRQHRKRTGVKVAAPRENWIVAAVEPYAKGKWKRDAQAILDKAIKPAHIK